jgi:hypothetical protein
MKRTIAFDEISRVLNELENYRYNLLTKGCATCNLRLLFPFWFLEAIRYHLTRESSNEQTNFKTLLGIEVYPHFKMNEVVLYDFMSPENNTLTIQILF